MQITFLGTGSMLPTKDRNAQATLVSYKNENILIDCGEGTQRQLKFARISPAKITKILITHWHGDHIFGLPGLLLTMGASHYSKTLKIYGPKGSKRNFRNLRNFYVPQNKIKTKLREIRKGKFFENEDFYIEAFPLKHNCPTIGFSFIEKDKRLINLKYLKKFGLKQHPILKKLQKGKNIVWKGKKIKASLATKIRKGKKVTFITDTVFFKDLVKFSNKADVLVCEATHLHELKERSKKFMHLTSKQAANIAKKAHVKKLILMHFSQRYRDHRPLEKEAKKEFKNTKCAYDFYKLKI